MMYPQAQTVENIQGLKQDPILTHRVLRREEILHISKGVCVCVCQTAVFVQWTIYTQRTLVKD